MPAPKAKESRGGERSWTRLVAPLRGPGRSWVAAAVVVLLFVAAATYGWHTLRERIAADPSFRVTADTIEITRQPDWIRRSVRDEVAVYGLTPKSSVRDPDLTVRIAQAFALHPWVKKVHRVSKHYPARVTVELEYRRPVALVEVVAADGQRGLLPVDAEGVLLPSEDFVPGDIGHYPRITVPEAAPVGPAGTPWGDPRVASGAAIAALLAPRWQEFGLYRIVFKPPSPYAIQASPPTFELHTREGLAVVWGRAPGQELQGEPPASQKMQRLRTALGGKSNGLPYGDGRILDLTGGETSAETPHTALEPVPWGR